MNYEPLRNRTNETVLLDTDYCCDVDDAAALALLCHECKSNRGRFKLGGVAVNVPGPYEAAAVKTMLAAFGMEDVPVGVTDGPIPPSGNRSAYMQALAARWRGADPGSATGLDVYRKVLTESEDASVTIISIGFFNNLNAAISNDIDLFHRKVRAVVAMAGGFGRKAGYVEFNVKNFPKDSIEFMEKWKGPLFFVGSECGESIMTDLRDIPEALLCHPLAEAFRVFSGPPMIRSSWDPITVAFSVDGENEYWKLGPPGFARATEESAVDFRESPSGTARYLYFTRDDQVISSHITNLVKRAVVSA